MFSAAVERLALATPGVRGRVFVCIRQMSWRLQLVVAAVGVLLATPTQESFVGPCSRSLSLSGTAAAAAGLP